MSSIFHRVKEKILSNESVIEDPRILFWNNAFNQAIDLMNQDENFKKEMREIRNKYADKGEDRTMGFEVIQGDRNDYKPLKIRRGTHIEEDGSISSIVREDDSYTLKLFIAEDAFFKVIEEHIPLSRAYFEMQKHIWAEGENVYRDFVLFDDVWKKFDYIFEKFGEILRE